MTQSFTAKALIEPWLGDGVGDARHVDEAQIADAKIRGIKTLISDTT
ncbi:MAG: hypothetical protein WBP94_02615 [Rhodomicrobiaceae bacterium]